MDRFANHYRVLGAAVQEGRAARLVACLVAADGVNGRFNMRNAAVEHGPVRDPMPL
jgi:hypothetical protein